MVRYRFDLALNKLNKDLIEMGNRAELAIEQAMAALKNHDEKLAHQVIVEDAEIDELEKKIEGSCLKLLLEQQPVARDLREISTALKMVTDIERICDQASDIAEISISLGKMKYVKEPDILLQMASLASKMVKKGIDAYVLRDQEAAKAVIALDDQVDDMFDQVKRQLMNHVIQDGESADQIVDFLMIAKYLERIGDHAENIADWVIFCVTGEHKNERII